jgi:hypothetical protein
MVLNDGDADCGDEMIVESCAGASGGGNAHGGSSVGVDGVGRDFLMFKNMKTGRATPPNISQHT